MILVAIMLSLNPGPDEYSKEHAKEQNLAPKSGPLRFYHGEILELGLSWHGGAYIYSQVGWGWSWTRTG